ncbi:FbpB family small basic protein [Alteribacter populi]|nr:FbpB family small basic protein [Alteribacter populi]
MIKQSIAILIEQNREQILSNNKELAKIEERMEERLAEKPRQSRKAK